MGIEHYLERDDGTRLRIAGDGVIVGRSPSCNVILADPRASKQHALIRATQRGLEVVPLGRHATLVDGQPISGPTPITDAQRIEVPGEQFFVRGGDPGPPDVALFWAIDTGGGRMLCPHRREWVMGGGKRDDVQVPGWPPAALSVTMAQGALLLTPALDGWVHEQRLHAEELYRARDGDRFHFGGRAVTVVCSNPASTVTTVAAAEVPHATRVAFSFRPQGGVLELHFADERRMLELSELRCRLLAVLLDPPGSYGPGDFVPDEIVLPAIWPGEFRDRKDLNLLIHRTRLDLIKAEVDPYRVLERLRSGGGTRFRLGPQTRVEVS